MKMGFLAIFLLYTFSCAIAKTIFIPEHISMCGMEIIISERGKLALEEISKTILINDKYFNAKLERIYLHLPLVEDILRKEGIPLDFKYLCMMESSMIADAVSTSNAVGYWQFKKEVAQEMGLRVDNWVDERKHIISSTLAAAKYLKKNNKVLDNWIYTALSYNLGLSGTLKIMDKSQFGSKTYFLNEESPRYIQKFVAYKLIFEQHPLTKNLSIYYDVIDYGDDYNLEIIAQKLNVTKEELKEHNKWLLSDNIPEDKKYPLLVLKTTDQNFKNDSNVANQFPDEIIREEKIEKESQNDNNFRTAFKKIWVLKSDDESNLKNEVAYIVQLNGLKAILAQPGDNGHKLSARGGIRYKKFLKYNELRTFDEIIPGKFYYLEPKKDQANVIFHIVQPNETIWSIAQLYGIQSESILRKNRMKEGEALAVGRKLYLKDYRPIDEPVLYENNKDDYELSKEDSVLVNNTKYINLQTNESNLKKNEKKPDKINPFAWENEKISDSSKQKSLVNHKKLIENCNLEKEKSIPEYHVVKEGETLYKIAKMYEIKLDSLKKWNNLKGYTISSGMRLKLTGIQSPPQSKNFIPYIVKSGDSIFKIANEFNLSIDEIMRFNQKTKAEIKVGEELKIPIK